MYMYIHVILLCFNTQQWVTMSVQRILYKQEVSASKETVLWPDAFTCLWIWAVMCMQAEYANVEVFKTEKKGWGLRALEPIPALVDFFLPPSPSLSYSLSLSPSLSLPLFLTQPPLSLSFLHHCLSPFSHHILFISQWFYLPFHSGTFVMEYCGEVCSLAHFEERKIEYVKEKRRHYYFMSLTADEVSLSILTSLLVHLGVWLSILTVYRP